MGKAHRDRACAASPGSPPQARSPLATTILVALSGYAALRRGRLRGGSPGRPAYIGTTGTPGARPVATPADRVLDPRH
ncbi:MAG TPA: hypothetical protein VIR33_02415, partial [Thermopolyspora sp.]